MPEHINFWIHAGYPKTATKSLQEMFFQHREIEYANNLSLNQLLGRLCSGRRAIYSQENICLLKDQEIAALQRFTTEAGMIVFIRDQVDILPSLYAQSAAFYLDLDSKPAWGPWLERVLKTDNKVRRMLHYKERLSFLGTLYPVWAYRYEHLKSDPEGTIKALAELLRIDAPGAVKIMGSLWLNKTAEKPEVTDAQRTAIRDEFGEYEKQEEWI